MRKVEGAAEEIELEKWDSLRDLKEDVFYNSLEQERLVVPKPAEQFLAGALTTYSRVCGLILQRSQAFLGSHSIQLFG